MIHSWKETEPYSMLLLVAREVQDVLKFLIRFFDNT